MNDLQDIDDNIKDNITSGENIYDGLIGTEIHMTGHDGSFKRGKVIIIVKGNDEKVIGTHTMPAPLSILRNRK